MSSNNLDARVGEVERDLSHLRSDVRVMSNTLTGLQSDVSKIATGIQDLITKDARRPEPVSGRTIAGTIVATAAGLGSVATVVWWLIGTAPAVQELQTRMTKLDDRETGLVYRMDRRIDRMETRLNRIEDWVPTVTPKSARR